MNETYYIGSYWRPRQESAEECARRARVFFENLASVDPLFERWFKQARSRKQALQRPLEADLAGLQQFFQRQVLRDDTRRAMDDMGFNLALWNGGSGGDDVGITLTCGAYWERVTNVCLLDPPNTGSHAERVLTAPILARVMWAMATAWEPDWGVAMSHSHRDLTEERGRADVLVGWVTYLSRRLGTVPPLPAPVRVELVEDKGTIIILTPERFTASNPEHVALTGHVHELLERAGVLHLSRLDKQR